MKELSSFNWESRYIGQQGSWWSAQFSFGSWARKFNYPAHYVSASAQNFKNIKTNPTAFEFFINGACVILLVLTRFKLFSFPSSSFELLSNAMLPWLHYRDRAASMASSPSRTESFVPSSELGAPNQLVRLPPGYYYYFTIIISRFPVTI